MLRQDLTETLTALVCRQLLLKHKVEHEIEHTQESGGLLIAELLLLAEAIVHVVEVKSELLDFVGRLIGGNVQNALESENFG